MQAHFNASSRSINAELSQLLVTVVLAISLFYSMLLLAYSWMVEDNIFNRQVYDEATYIQEVYQATGDLIDPRPSYMTLHEDWRGLPQQFKEEQRSKPDKIEFQHPDGRTVHIQLFTLGNTVYVLAADVEGYEVSREFLPGVLWLLALLSVFLCVVVAVIALRKARKITYPLNQLANQVASEKNVEDIVISGDYPGNEIGQLAEIMQNTFERLTQTLIRETHFTKDVSHEIRTPVAISRNILAKPMLQVSDDEWQTLRDANVRLEQTTETLLALARKESTLVTRTNLTALFEQCLLNNPDINYSDKGQNIAFEIACDKDIFRAVNRNLVSILFNNVLSNIVHYTAGYSVSVLIDETEITFTNHYQKQPPTDPLKSGEKGESSQGMGHGLSLIQRIADVYSWHVQVDVADRTFQLTLHI